MRSRAWLAFGALSTIWGSSFLWIKIAVQEVGPFRLVAFRLLFGVIGLLIAGRLTRQPLRLSRKQLPSYLVLALVNTALPFTLISWGSTRTSVVTYTMPVIGVILGIVFLGETLSLSLILGVALVLTGIGFVNWRPRRAERAAVAES